MRHKITLTDATSLQSILFHMGNGIPYLKEKCQYLICMTSPIVTIRQFHAVFGSDGEPCGEPRLFKWEMTEEVTSRWMRS